MLTKINFEVLQSFLAKIFPYYASSMLNSFIMLKIWLTYIANWLAPWCVNSKMLHQNSRMSYENNYVHSLSLVDMQFGLRIFNCLLTFCTVILDSTDMIITFVAS